jgi:hypothetical protein
MCAMSTHFSRKINAKNKQLLPPAIIYVICPLFSQQKTPVFVEGAMFLLLFCLYMQFADCEPLYICDRSLTISV